MIPEAIRFEGDALLLLDQRRLPGQVVWNRYTGARDTAQAIRDLVVRGAPAIGISAAYALALEAAFTGQRGLGPAGQELVAARPTAVNLGWAVRRMLDRAERAQRAGESLEAALRREAETIHAEDRDMCRRIGRHGVTLLGPRPRVLTHCNAGALATGGMGTALAPVYVAQEEGREPRVYADETRPIMQGARLTCWELTQAGVDVTLLVDSAAAYLLATGEIESVWVGADRIADNGDVANKIGTYGLACAAARANVPFYVAAPRSTFDPDTATGADIAIEMRAGEELSAGFAEQVSPSNIKTWTPAFDITPRALVSAYVSDRGIQPGGRGQTA